MDDVDWFRVACDHSSSLRALGYRTEEDYEAEAEQEAENAWLRYAEMPTMEDYAFEQWERSQGLCQCSLADLREIGCHCM